MKVVKKNSNRPNYYKEYNQVLFWSILVLFDKVEVLNLNIDLINAAVFYAANRERTKRSLPPCDFHPKLAEISMLHSLQMKKFNFFSHENRYEKGYRTLKDRLEAVYSNNFKGFRSAAENYELEDSNSRYEGLKVTQNFGGELMISKRIIVSQNLKLSDS